MSYSTVYANQTLEAGGIPRTEFRYAPDPCDIQIISIEFQPDPDCISDDLYPQPQYTFMQSVALRRDWESYQRHHLDWREDLQFYEVCTLRLIQPKSKLTRRLTEAPFWLYGLQRESNSGDILWAEEEDLVCDILPRSCLRIESGLLSDPWHPIGRFLSFKDEMTHRPISDVDCCIVVAVKTASAA